MKFEELETTWAVQRPATAGGADHEAMALFFLRQIRRRTWLLNLVALSVVAGLILVPLLTIASYSSRPVEDRTLDLVRLTLHQGIYLAFLWYLVRRIRRQRRLVRSAGESVRTILVNALASVEDEIFECRLAKWVTPIFTALPLFSAYVNNPVTRLGWAPFGLRVFLIFTLIVPACLVGWRHYRRNLLPEQARLKATLEQLDRIAVPE